MPPPVRPERSAAGAESKGRSWRWNGFPAWKGHAFLALAARFYLGGIFLVASWHKLLDPKAFALDVATYQILPLSLVNAMAIVLPWVEIAAAILLFLGLRARAAALLVAGMMTMFLVALAIALERGLNLSCGCFASASATEDPISWRTLARDGFWLALALYVVVFDRSPIGLDRLAEWRAARRTSRPA